MEMYPAHTSTIYAQTYDKVTQIQESTCKWRYNITHHIKYLCTYQIKNCNSNPNPYYDKCKEWLASVEKYVYIMVLYSYI